MKGDCFCAILLGFALRVGCIFFRVRRYFVNRIEIVSPLTSKKRAIECLYLYDNGISPYSSDVCHQPPLMIWLSKYIPLDASFYLICDMMTALMLYYMVTWYSSYSLEKQSMNLKYYWKEVKPILLSNQSFESTPLLVLSIYLFNPYSLVTFCAESSIILNNVCIVSLLLLALQGWIGLAGCFVSIATYLSPYNVILLFPVLLLSREKDENVFIWFMYPLLSFTLSTGLLFYSSYYIFQSWDFISAVYGFTFEVSDLTPNMSLFWYFFLEMFDHFRLFFLWVFQLNVFVYVPPLMIVFKERPIFLFYLYISLITLCKSYSNFADMILPLAMLPLWSYVYRYTRNVLFIGALFIVSSLLAPVMWYLWIYAGSGNANFFYAVTLAYSCAQIFLLSDILYAVLRYDYHLRNGLFPKTDDGRPGHLVLK